MKLLKNISLALFGIALFTACESSETKVLDESVENLLQEEAIMEEVVNEVYNESDEVLANLGFGMKSTGDAEGENCKVVTVDTDDENYFPKTVTIDFGDGCANRNGVIRAGKIIIVVTGPKHEQGSERTVTFENFSVDSNMVAGTKKMVNLGPDVDGNIDHQVNIDITVTLPDGTEVTRTAERNRKFMIAPWEESRMRVWEITGQSSGINCYGKAYTNTITQKLVKNNQCRWIVSGIIERIVEGENPAYLDFGSGDCDNKATLTQNGEITEIELKGRLKGEKFRKRHQHQNGN